MIPPGSEGEAKAGQIVVADIVRQPDKHRIPTGRITKVLGDHMAPGIEIDLAIEAHGIPNVWPDDVIAEAEQIPHEVRDADLEGRVDLRALPRSEEHTSELQSRGHLVCRLLLEIKKMT